MITLQHTALYAQALWQILDSQGRVDQFDDLFVRDIPWVLLPDAIRAFSGPRQTSHFETLPDRTDNGWMEFPLPQILKGLTKENFATQVNFYLPQDGWRKAVIGEETLMEQFYQHNWSHPFAAQLAAHLLQDRVLDATIREMVDCSGRFNDTFAPSHNKEWRLNGQMLRQHIATFESEGFLYLVREIKKSTSGGLVIDKDWVEEYVQTALYLSYPKDLAANTLKFMGVSEEQNDRIHAGDFQLQHIPICEDVEGTLALMYAEALLNTKRAIVIG